MPAEREQAVEGTGITDTERERESDEEGDRKRDGATDLGALELFAYAAKNVEHVDNI